MAIVSISKIQHRYGVLEDLPQLSAAEFGWALDRRRLFIGNGPIGEGAPEIGNTEVLTEYSDILNFGSYDYRGLDVGYLHQTGSSLTNPTVRTLQSKLDEVASVKDFGAVGDGETDDTVAINQALYELFAKTKSTQIRRALFFPAGTYKTTEPIKIPAYARLFGDGKDCSIISGSTVELADGFQQTGGSIGNSVNSVQPEMPGFVEIYDMSFQQTSDGGFDTLTIISAKNCRFQRVGIHGYTDAAPTAPAPNSTCVKLESTQAIQTASIVFEDCDFTNNIYAIVADDDMSNILINASTFKNLYKGAYIGANTTGLGKSITGPKGFKITNCEFDKINSHAIHVLNDVSGVVSAFNYFNDVGNDINNSNTPTSSVINFVSAGNTSLHDVFERTDLEAETAKKINDNGLVNYIATTGESITHGRSIIGAGKLLTLSAATNQTISSNFVFDSAAEHHVQVRYTAKQGNNVRSGVIRINGSDFGTGLSDDFIENGDAPTPMDLTFSLATSSGEFSLNYTSSGDDISFSYQIEKLI